MCPVERRVHNMQQDYACSIEQETLLLVNIDGNNVIFPRKARVKKIIDFFIKPTKEKEHESYISGFF